MILPALCNTLHVLCIMSIFPLFCLQLTMVMWVL
jgi:hypothetical protein